MINRQNWLDVKNFMAFYERIGKNEASVKRVRSFMRHLLEWADDKPFTQARNIDPSFQTYLLTARADGKDIQLAPASMKKACEYARMFFGYSRSEHPARYRQISASWIETIRPSTAKGLHSRYHEHLYWPVESVEAIAALTPKNLTEERDRAAVCFLFLSAMRAQAFVSMPTSAVDLKAFKIKQFPELGVKTKNGKAAITSLLRIPSLLEVVHSWDEKVRAERIDHWYPRIDRWHRFVEAESGGMNWESRAKLLDRGIKGLCEQAGLPYLSAHKLRHGHIVYSMERIKSMEQLKALSQNMMHESVGITDGVYGRLKSDEIGDLYASL
jgi:integrase